MLFIVLVQPRLKRPLKDKWRAVAVCGASNFEIGADLAARLHDTKKFSVKTISSDRLTEEQVAARARETNSEEARLTRRAAYETIA
jgi:hypothetical protein